MSRRLKKIKGKKESKNIHRQKTQKIDINRLEKVLKSIISEVAEVAEKKIGPNTRFAEDLDINSMMALEILASIEKRYKIEIPEENLPKMATLKNVMKIVKQLLL